MSVYPGTLDTFPTKVAKLDLYRAAHMNDVQAAIVAVETELGTHPAGSLTDLKTRLAIRIADDGKLKQPQQLVTVGKTNADYTTIQGAIDAISDAASDKIYTILVHPGQYDEQITLKDYVDIVAINPHSTKILKRVMDAGVACHCFLNITIDSFFQQGLLIANAASEITFVGNITARGVKDAISISAGTLTVTGNLSSELVVSLLVSGGTVTITGNMYSDSGSVITQQGGTLKILNGLLDSGSIAVTSTAGDLTIENTTVTTRADNPLAHGISLGTGTLILQDVKIICTHADAKSINVIQARDARCMGVWANRDDHADVTQLIPGGFTFDADVQ